MEGLGMKKLCVAASFASRWADLIGVFKIAEAWFFFDESRPAPERELPRSFFKFFLH
jgi:hypothetical protein